MLNNYGWERPNWHDNGVSIGDVFRLDDGAFEHRLGHTWAKGRLKQADLIVAVKHSGDGFFDYLLLQEVPLSDRMTVEALGKPFGAYTIGRKVATISKDEVASLLAGLQIAVVTEDDFGARDPSENCETPFRTFRQLANALKSIPETMLDQNVGLFDDGGVLGYGGTVDVNHTNGRAMIVPIA